MSKEFDYTKLKHATSVDQSDREVPYNLRQSGPTKVEMLISTRVRKSPYWHLSMQAGCWRATVYNRIYHPRGYVKPEDGGAMVEYDAIVNHVTMWNVAVERQIRVKGPDAEKFVDYVITRDATLYADDMWNAVLKAGEKHNLMVIAPAHHRRIQAGILSWGQDMDQQHNPFQCNLGYQVSLSGKGEWNKKSDYVGKEVLEKMKSEIKAGKKPYKLQLVGLELGGKPIEDYAPDFWLISNANGGDPVGFITSPWWHPEKKTNIAMGYVPFDGTLNANGFPKGKVGTKFKVHLPEKYSNSPGQPVDAVIVDIPFKESFNANTREVVSG